MCKTFGFCLQSMFDPNFQSFSSSYADELGNFHPDFPLLVAVLIGSWLIKTEACVSGKVSRHLFKF